MTCSRMKCHKMVAFSAHDGLTYFKSSIYFLNKNFSPPERKWRPHTRSFEILSGVYVSQSLLLIAFNHSLLRLAPIGVLFEGML